MVQIDVIATTISGSISDWKKVERIIPLLKEYGFNDVHLHEVDSHDAAREVAGSVLSSGARHPISAGGSGTFRAVLEGCIDSGVNLKDIRLGFLRKGSADLIGKVLEMPDDIEKAITVFAEAIEKDSFVAADILQASSTGSAEKPRHFLGYGGAEIFGRIPHFTENRFVKYYKGILGQLFGDLGPFTTGMALAVMEKLIKAPFTKKKYWRLVVDGRQAAEGYYQALLVVNGYLGPDLSFSDKPLDSGEFYVFGIKNLGMLKMLSQAKHALRGTIADDPDRFGFESITVRNSIEFISETDASFPVNVDGSTFLAQDSVKLERKGKVPLIKKA